MWYKVLAELIIELIIKLGGEKVLTLVKSKMIKKMPKRLGIEVPRDGHFVRCGDPEKNVSFHIMFTKFWPMVLNIVKIDYAVSYEDKIIQQKTWNEPEEMKRNNNKLLINLLYYPMESQWKIPSLNGWKIKGTATIVCVYGTFQKSFESPTLNIYSDTPWEKLMLVDC